MMGAERVADTVSMASAVALSKRQRRRINDRRKGARNKLIRYAEKMGGAPISGLSQMSDEVLSGLLELPIPVLEETMFDSGSARNLIKRSLVE